MAKIAFLLGQQFEDSEMSEPYEAVARAPVPGMRADEKASGSTLA